MRLHQIKKTIAMFGELNQVNIIPEGEEGLLI